VKKNIQLGGYDAKFTVKFSVAKLYSFWHTANRHGNVTITGGSLKG